jgi:hypothetical protein
MLVDLAFRNSLRGKSLKDLRNWFPETTPPVPKSWQAEWLKGHGAAPNETYEVIGDGGLAISLRNGKFDSIVSMKG